MDIAIRLTRKGDNIFLIGDPYICGRGNLPEINKYIQDFPSKCGDYKYQIPNHPKYKSLRFDIHGINGFKTVGDVFSHTEMRELRRIKELVEDELDLDITEKVRIVEVVAARRIYYLFCWLFTEIKFFDITHYIGFDHTSLIQALGVLRNMVDTKHPKTLSLIEKFQKYSKKDLIELIPLTITSINRKLYENNINWEDRRVV